MSPVSLAVIVRSVARTWCARTGVPAEVLDYVREHRCPVLLVSDVVDSRWAFTAVARELRLAGASAVYPFSLAATH